mgnify:CR=1 FL=1
MTSETQKMPRPMGRPTEYTQDIADKICAWLAGGQSLRAFCRQDNTPALSTVCLWIVSRDDFSEQYRRAREAAGYAHGDGVVEIVELLRSGAVDPQTGKAMMDGLKWSAERMAPKAHVAKQSLEHTGADGGAIQTEDVTKRDAESFTGSILGLVARSAEASETDEPEAGNEGGS